MHQSIALPLFVLPALLAPAFGIPVELRTGSSETERWVRKENTLNATTWNGKEHKVVAPAVEKVTTTVTLLETTTSALRPSRTASYIYTPTIINAPQQPKVNTTNNWNSTTSASNTTSNASSNTTVIESSNGTLPNASVNATLSNSSVTTNTTVLNSSFNATSSNNDASGRAMTHQSDGSFTTTTNTTALLKTFNTTIDARDLNSTGASFLPSGDGDKSIDYTITRDNTFTDIQGALHRSSNAIVTENGTRIEGGRVATGVDGTISRGIFTLELVNKLASDNVRAYISGLDTNGALVMLGQDGQWVFPSTDSATPEPVQGNIRIPMGKTNSTTPVALPGFISSARVWIADGNLDFYVVATPNGPGLVEPSTANSKDPNSEVNYSFAEFSWAADYGIYVNISYVDFVGLPLGMELSDYDNVNHSVLGVPANAAEVLCEQLKDQTTKDGQPWDQLCAYDSSGKVRRVMAPPNLIAQNASAFEGYFSTYVDDVWSWYSSNNLTINTQSDPGNITCSIQNDDELHCDGDNRSYAKPTSQDIFGCNDGPFSITPDDNPVHLAVVPRFCAAFNRATFMVEGGEIQPGVGPDLYYPADVAKNFYSDFVKRMQVEGRGYAFSYDDVAPEGLDRSGLVGSTSPRVLRIIVGGA